MTLIIDRPAKNSPTGGLNLLNTAHRSATRAPSHIRQAAVPMRELTPLLANDPTLPAAAAFNSITTSGIKEETTTPVPDGGRVMRPGRSSPDLSL